MLVRFRAGVLAGCMVLVVAVSLTWVSIAAASEEAERPVIESVVKNTTSEFEEGIAAVVVFIGLVVAVSLAVAFFKRHSRKV